MVERRELSPKALTEINSIQKKADSKHPMADSSTQAI
jgi:hypothetical protein